MICHNCGKRTEEFVYNAPIGRVCHACFQGSHAVQDTLHFVRAAVLGFENKHRIPVDERQAFDILNEREGRK